MGNHQVVVELNKFKDGGIEPLVLLVPFRLFDVVFDMPCIEVPELMTAILIGREGTRPIIRRIPHEEKAL